MVAKFKYIRSKKLMELYRTIPCQRCGTEDGTVVGAHSNQQKHGKGRGIKASDEYCASLCYECHDWLDFGKATRYLKISEWDLAHESTKERLNIKYGQHYTDLIQ